MDLQDKVVIVTGAGGNLGAAVARRLASAGARLVLADLNAAPLEALRRELSGEHVPLDGVDLRRKDAAEHLAQTTLDRFGRIDALANTVGTFKMAEVDGGGAAEQWTLLMELNALSALRASEAVLPAMRRQKYGRIAHTAAGAAHKAFAGASIYSASKAALLRLTEAIAEENRAFGITANCVLPGTMDTPQNRAAMPNADASGWVKPDAVAEVFAFLVSPASSAVNGAGVPAAG